MGIYTEYFTTNKPLPYMRARSTMFNESSASIWEQGKHQMLNDSRSKTLRQFSKEYEEAADAWMKKNALDPTKELPKGKQALLDKYLDETYGAKLRELKEAGGLPLRAISRAWIPEWNFAGTTHLKAAQAYNRTYKALSESKTLTEFFDKVGMSKDPYPKSISESLFGKPVLPLKSMQHAIYALAHAAIQHRTNIMAVKVTGFVTPEAVSDTAKLFAGEAHRVKNFDQMVDTMNRFGLPSTQAHYVRSTGAAVRAGGETTSKKLIATGTDMGSGDTIFLPETLARTIDDAMPKVTKDINRRLISANTPEEVAKILPEFDYVRLWKTSIVTGLFVPRPKYFWNNYIGDFGQMWFEHGFGIAASVSAQTLGRESFNLLGNYFPGASHMKKFYIESAKKYGPEKTQGSTWNALFNPHANKIWRGEQGVLRTRYGAEYQYSEVRKFIQEEGILDTMVHAELLSSFSRNVPNSWIKSPWLKSPATLVDDQMSNISWLATHVQQRQRGNLFFELLNRGYKPKDAGRLVKASLYDWKHGITRWEAMTLGKVSPFYRFWRLAFGQTTRRLMEPLVSPNKAALDAAMGRSALARLRQQQAVFESIPHLTDPELAYEIATEQEARDHAAKYYTPSWARHRHLGNVRPMDDIEKDHYFKMRKQILTHSMMVMPPITNLETTDLALSFGAGIAGMGIEMMGGELMGAKVGPESTERFFRPISTFAAPWIAGPIDATLKGLGAETGTFKRGSKMRINAWEAAVLGRNGTPVMTVTGASAGLLISGMATKRYPWMRATIGAALGGGYGAFMDGAGVMENEDGVLVADTAAVVMFRATPLLGQELGQVFNAFHGENPYTQYLATSQGSKDPSMDLIIKAGKHFAGAWGGYDKRYGFSPLEVREWRSKKIMKKAEEHQKTRFKKEDQPGSKIYKNYPDSEGNE